MDPWVPPVARQCLASCGESMQPVPRGWRNWCHWMSATLAWPKPNRTPLGHCLGPSNGTRLHLSLSRSSMMPWSRSGRKYPRTPFVVSLGAYPVVVRHAYKYMGAIQTTVYHFELLQFIFISIKQCGILSFLTHYPVHICKYIHHDIFPQWGLMSFQSIPYFFEQCIICNYFKYINDYLSILFGADN